MISDNAVIRDNLTDCTGMWSGGFTPLTLWKNATNSEERCYFVAQAIGSTGDVEF